MTDRKETTKSFLIRTMADPVLIYAVIAMMSIMNHYRSMLTVRYGIAAYVVGWVVFRLFDYINKHHFIGFFAYILLFGAFITGSIATIKKGRKNYPISWGLWFLTPQEAMQYNKWYTLAIFMLFLIFMLSVIYYFTRVRYRLFMNFLILIIPFSIYGKENEEMEIGYIIALCVGFFVILANFRQMSDNEKAKTVDRPEMFRSAAVFTVLFAVVSALVPKPVIEADRTMIETMINADALTDRFLKMLDVFRDDTEGQQFRQNLGDIPLYYAVSPQPLQLKTSTFTTYNYEKDTWKSADGDSRYWYRDDKPFPIFYNGGVAEAVLYAARIDEKFSEKYGLSDYVNTEIDVPESRRMTITAIRAGGQTAPVPAGAENFQSSSFDETLGLTKSGIIFAHEEEFAEREQFSYSYVSPSFFVKDTNKAVVDYIASIDDYAQLLLDAAEVVEYEFDGTAEKYADILNENLDFYESAVENLLDYGGNERIYALAQELTAGLDSPYEKAKILESYFIENDYIYDLDYRKEVGENAEDFLFETKRGVCYEYATAMTLLARAAGIPARYCEGFNMQTQYGDTSGSSYIITANDAHGFPELYIEGYGWMCFEPTVTNGVVREEEKSVTSLLTNSGLIILGFSALVLVLILLWHKITHRVFLILVKRKSPEKAVSAVIHRICRIYGIPRTSSVREAEAEVYRRASADISSAALIFERAEYGGITLTEDEKTKAIETYIAAYIALNDAEKAERKARRNKKRAQ